MALAAALLFALAPAAAQAQDTVIGFEDQPDGTVVTDQYADVDGPGRGIVFAPQEGPFTDSALPLVRAAEGTHILDTSGCAGELCRPYVVARFSDPRREVAVIPGIWSFDEGTASTVELIGYDAQANEVARASAGVGLRDCNFSCTLGIRAASDEDRSRWITHVVIQAVVGSGSRKIGIDAIRFDRPETVEQDFALAWSHDGALGVRQGQTSSAAVHITRLGGFDDAVRLSVSAIPAGMSASFAPDSTDGTGSTLTLYASPDAEVRAGEVTIRGEASSGQVRELTIPVEAHANFALAGDTRYPVPASVVDLPACTVVPILVPLYVPLAPGDAYLPGSIAAQLEGDVRVSAYELPPGIVTPEGSERRVRPGGLFALPLMVEGGPLPGESIVKVSADRAPYPTSFAEVRLRPAPGVIREVQRVRADGSVETLPPGAQIQPGERLRLVGRGFCPGASVRFGAIEIDADGELEKGSTMEVTVPADAASGPISVVQGKEVLTSPHGFVVHDYRGINGFSFGNTAALLRAANPGRLEVVEQAWGRSAVYYTVTFDPCPLWKCPVRVTVTRPEAIQVATLASRLTGLCLGFATGSIGLSRDPKARAGFRPAGAPDVWSLTGPAGPTDALRGFLAASSIRQFGEQPQNARKHYVPTDGAGVRDRVDGALRAGDPPVALIRSGGQGHALVPYRVDLSSTGQYMVRVYDPNRPYLAAETTNAKLRRDQLAQSTIVVNRDGSWSYAPLGWSGDRRSLLILRSSIYATATLPSSLSTIGAWVFGSAGSELDLRDADGRDLLADDGEPVDDRVTRLSPTDANVPGAPMYALPADRAVTARIDADKGFELDLLTKGFGAHVTGRDRGELRTEPAARAVSLMAKGTRELTLLHDRAVLSARVVGGEGKDRLSIVGGRPQLQHTGAPAVVQIEAATAGGRASFTTVRGIRLRDGDRASVTRGGSVRVTDRRGRAVRTVGPARAAGPRAKAGPLAVRAKGRTSTLRIGVDPRRLPHGTTVVTSIVVRKGRRIMARTTKRFEVRDGRTAPRQVSLRFRPGGGRRVAEATVATIVPGLPPTVQRQVRRRALR